MFRFAVIGAVFVLSLDAAGVSAQAAGGAEAVAGQPAAGVVEGPAAGQSAAPAAAPIEDAPVLEEPAVAESSASAADPVAEGLAHYGAGRGEQAAASFRRALEAAPDDPALHGWLGMALLQAGSPAEAIAVLRRAVTLEPDVGDHHVRLGRAYEAAGDLASARLAYLDAMRVEPGHAEARQALAALEASAQLSYAPEDAPEDAPEHAWSGPPVPRRKSYATMLTIGYVAAPLAALAIGAATESPIALIAFLTPAIVHAAYNQPGRALLSPFGMTGLSLLGGYGTLVASDCDSFGCFGSFALGMLIGYAVWAAIDIAVFSSYTVDEPLVSSPGRGATSASTTPAHPKRRGIGGLLAGAGVGLAAGVLSASGVVCDGRCFGDGDTGGAVVYTLVYGAVGALVGDGAAAAIAGDRTSVHMPLAFGTSALTLLGGVLLGAEALDRADQGDTSSRELGLAADVLLVSAVISGSVGVALALQADEDGADQGLLLAPLVAQDGAGLQLSWRR